MKINGCYLISPDYISLIEQLGGRYRDNKTRPIYCCIQDKYHPFIYWAIPTSLLDSRSDQQITRIEKYCSYPERDIRSCFYHIGHTNRPAIFRISNALPITRKYIDKEYISQGSHLVLKDKALIAAVERKLSRILFDEHMHPNKYEQHMTSIYVHLQQENVFDEVASTLR